MGESISNILEVFLRPAVVVFVVVVLLFVNAWIFKIIKATASSENIAKFLISFLLVLVGIIAFILVLPIEKELRGQIISFIGIIFSAGIALSATTVLGNFIAGIMNNSMKRFRNGDLIKIGDFHGKVIKKSIFHTEIQLEDSNFITIPNLYIANNPVKLTKKSNTIISTSVSLGYDIPRDRVEKALLEAATSVGLKDAYVYITNLGDFSVVYKIHGFLEDSSTFFSTNSQLNAKVMDKLHSEKIEIVSPTFMNQRRVEEQVFIPKQPIKEAEPKDVEAPEDLVFEEAIESEKIELKKDRLKELEEKQKALKDELKEAKDEQEEQRIKKKIAKIEEVKERLKKQVEEEENEGKK